MIRRQHTRGFSLPELMVTLVIGLVLILVVSTMVARQEDLRRGISSANELANNVAYSAFVLDRELRNAGAGLAGSVNWGCPLAVSKNNGQLLPRLQPFPDPFGNVSQTYVVAPIVVFAGAALTDRMCWRYRPGTLRSARPHKPSLRNRPRPAKCS